MAARDIFAAVVEAMSRQGKSYSNAGSKSQLELPAEELLEFLDVSEKPEPGRGGPVSRGGPEA